MKLILASKSPRRRELLQRLNYPFDIILSDVDESLIPFDGSAEDYCRSLADLKSKNIASHYPNSLVIGADTIVVVEGQVLEKPYDKDQALQMLKTLSAKTHQVFTGVSLNWINKNIQHQFAEMTQVTFREIDSADIDHYIETCLPYDKAGAYGIQDWSAVFVDKIHGCYDNVVGFPLSRFYQELKKLGINLLDTISESS